jgi:hypothetical protein
MNTLRRVVLTIVLFLFLGPVSSYAKTEEGRMLTQAREQYQAGNYYFASTWMERLLKEYPTTTQRQEVLLLLAKSYASTGRDAKAVVTLRELLKDFPKAAETLDPKLLKLLDMGDPSHTEYSLADVQDAPVEPVPAASVVAPVAPKVAVAAAPAVAPVPVAAPVAVAKQEPAKKTWWIFASGSRPAPAEVKPAQPKVAEAKPAESKPAESKPVGKAADQNYSLDDLAGLAPPAAKFTAKPKDPKLAAARPAEPKTVEAKTAEAKTAEAKTAEAKTAEAETAEAKTAEAKLAETKPVEAKPVEAKPVEAKPVEAKPVGSKTAEQNYTLDDLAGLALPAAKLTAKPKDPKLAAARPAEPKTTEPKTAEPKTAEPKTAEPKTVEPKTVEPKTAESKPVGVKTVEQDYSLDDLAGLALPAAKLTAKPKDPKLAATRPAEPKTAEAKLAAPKAGEPKPVEPKNAELNQSGLKAAAVKPAEIKPAEIKPAEVKPAAVKPALQDYTLDDLKDPTPVEATKPVEIKKAEPKLSGVNAAQLKPAGPEPAQKVYSLDDLADPTPYEAKAVTPKPADPKLVEPKVVAIKPVEPKVVAPKVVEQKPAAPKVVAPKVVAPKTVQPKTIEPKTIEPKTIEPKPVGPVAKKDAGRSVIATAVPVVPAAPKSQQKVLKTAVPAPVAAPSQSPLSSVVGNPANPTEATCYTLQIGEYVVQPALGEAKKRVKSLGLEPVVEPGEKKKEPMTRLSLGEYPSQAAAKKGLEKLRAAKVEGFFLLEEDQKYHVYAGSYSDEKGAAKELQRFAALGLKLSLKQVVVAVPTFVLTAGNFPTREAALAKAEELERQGVRTRVVERCLLGKLPAARPVRK